MSATEKANKLHTLDWRQPRIVGSEDDSFRAGSKSASKVNLLSIDRSMEKLRMGPKAPSFAASSRDSVYMKMGSSYYKQSGEKDPLFWQIESRGSQRIPPKEDLRPGVIIRVVDHEQDFRATSAKSDSTAAADKYVTQSKFGPIFTKFRKMIIISVHEHHYVAV